MSDELNPGEELGAIKRHRDDSSDVFLPALDEEPIDDLRKRLAEGWIRFKRIQAWKLWGKKRGDKLDLSNLSDPSDSFYNWVMTEPEQIVRHFAAESGLNWNSELARKLRKQASATWNKAVEDVLPLIFNLMWVSDPSNPSGGSTAHRITMEELIVNPDYRGADETAQYVARYLVEKCQTQKADGAWTLIEPANSL